MTERIPAKQVRLKQTSTSTTLDIKRCYLPFILKANCPHCGHIMEEDLNRSYLSYPSVGCYEKVTFQCRNCEENPDVKNCEYETTIVLKLTATVEDEP